MCVSVRVGVLQDGYVGSVCMCVHVCVWASVVCVCVCEV